MLWSLFGWWKRFFVFHFLVGTNWWHILKTALIPKPLLYNRYCVIYFQFPHLWRITEVHVQHFIIRSCVCCQTAWVWMKRGSRLQCPELQNVSHSVSLYSLCSASDWLREQTANQRAEAELTDWLLLCLFLLCLICQYWRKIQSKS